MFLLPPGSVDLLSWPENHRLVYEGNNHWQLKQPRLPKGRTGLVLHILGFSIQAQSPMLVALWKDSGVPKLGEQEDLGHAPRDTQPCPGLQAPEAG